MNALNLNFWGKSKAWWAVLAVGVLMILSGFAYWFWPAIGYAVASQLFGWMLILFGVVQLCVTAGNERPRGWGWLLAGGVLNIFIGFMLVRNVTLAEAVFPWFLAFVFVYWGFATLVASIQNRGRKNWWLQLINGILLVIIGFFFIEAGYLSELAMVSFLTSLAFIYWGFAIGAAAYDMKPNKIEE